MEASVTSVCFRVWKNVMDYLYSTECVWCFTDKQEDEVCLEKLKF